jgi:uncharacterized protein (DUF305 family)
MRHRAAAVLLGAALVLGGCGTDAEPVTTESATAEVRAGADFNDTDVMYLQMMVAHHEQGIEMVRIAEKAAKREATGTKFEATFLNLFLAHQHEAVEMTKVEETGGANAEAKAFAERVRQSRADQIRQILNMLNG